MVPFSDNMWSRRSLIWSWRAIIIESLSGSIEEVEEDVLVIEEGEVVTDGDGDGDFCGLWSVKPVLSLSVF